MPTSIIIIGASARAAAGSALRAGFEPFCVDLFADRDLLAMARVRRCPADRYPEAIPELLNDFPPADVVLTGAMENHLGVVEKITRTHRLRGPSLDAIRQLRQPDWPLRLPAIPGVSFDHVILGGRNRWWRRLVAPVAATRYVSKPIASGGGGGVEIGSAWRPVGADRYLQEFVPGVTYGAVCVGDTVGVAEQIVGDARFGASHFRYAGSIGPIDLPPAAAVSALTRSLRKTFAIDGLFGIDFILDSRGRVCPIEINPRYTASVEVHERAGGFLAFGAARLSGPRLSKNLFAKAILFAKNDTLAPDLYDHFTPGEIADVPTIGEPIRKGHPICTLFAGGSTRDECLAGLHTMADRLYTRLSP